MSPLSIFSVSVLTLLTGGLLYYSKVVMRSRTFRHTVDSMRLFSTAIELRFPEQSGLTERIANLCQMLAEQLKLSRPERENLELACRLRDIGQCAIPWKLINCREMGTWTRAEIDTFLKHPEIGSAMIELVPSIRHIASSVRYQYANFDGSSGRSFPAAEDIPIESRILNVVVTYINAERRVGSILARDELKSRSGTKFDPLVVETLMMVLPSIHVPAARESSVKA